MLSFWMKTLLPFSSTEKRERKREWINQIDFQNRRSHHAISSRRHKVQYPINFFDRLLRHPELDTSKHSAGILYYLFYRRGQFGVNFLTFSATDIRYCAVTVHPPFYCILCPLLATNRDNYFRYDIQFQINHRVQMHHVECRPWVVLYNDETTSLFLESYCVFHEWLLNVYL